MSAPMSTTLFKEAVGSVLNSWTVLQLAVTHGFGGHESKEKAEWLSYAIDTWFSENNNLDPSEVEDYLSEVMNTEFDTIADDGSLPGVAAEICAMYKFCQADNEAEVRNRIEKLPKAGVQKSTRADSGDEEIGVGNSLSAGEGNTMKPSAEMTVDVGMDEVTNSSEAPTDNTAMEEEEDDGWQVVTKSRQKKNEKNNFF